MKFFFILISVFLFAYSASAAEVDLSLEAGYVAEKISVPSGTEKFALTEEQGILFYVQTGGTGKLIARNLRGEESVVADKLNPLESLASWEEAIFIATPGRISSIRTGGKAQDVLTGMPTGDYGLSPIVTKNGMLYFAQGTVTNSGVVGPDNPWLSRNPSLHDLSCKQVFLAGLNVTTDNFLTKKNNDKAVTGSFMPFNAPSTPGVAAGSIKCTGSVYSMSPDGKNLKLLAWGMHAPLSVSVGDAGSVWVLDRAMEERGSRPVRGGKDALYRLEEGAWYGWPDYSAGEKVDQSKVFAVDPGPVPQPYKTFPPGRYKAFLIPPDEVFQNKGVLVSTESLETLDEISENLQKIATVVDSAKILSAVFGRDALYVLTEKEGSRVLYRINSSEDSVTRGGAGQNSVIWPWIMNSVLLALGVAAFFVLKRPASAA